MRTVHKRTREENDKFKSHIYIYNSVALSVCVTVTVR